MSALANPIAHIDGAPLTEEQSSYLTGFFAGIAARGLRFSDVEQTPASGTASPSQDLIFEERVKREQHPLDAYERLVDLAAANKSPEKDDLFRLKWNGLFYLTPTKESYMARLRIPGGVLSANQFRDLARTAQDLTSGYVQITTRANLQIRLIQPKDTPEVLRRIQSVGLHTRGAGADNIRNITMHATSGIDTAELFDVQPLVRDLGQRILNDRAFYDLPRKFNIAYDGGGAIGSVEDTNDIGAKAVRAADGSVGFRIALGGATGHKTFASDLGILVPPTELNRVVLALVRVFIANGNRSDRKRARLKHLLEKWTLNQYLAETEKLLGMPLNKVPLEDAPLKYPPATGHHSHVGAFPQKQAGLFYIGAGVPVGQLTPKQMVRLAEIAELYGSGEVRLTVWQSVLLPNIPEAFVKTACKALEKVGLHTVPSPTRSGIIACTGSRYCKFAQADTKSHALALADYLEKKVRLDQPVNIHFTGCPHSCAQHYMGDIGLLGTRVKTGGGSVDGYHVFVGGGFGGTQAVGRQIFTAIPENEINALLEQMLTGYLRARQGPESFQSFTLRQDVNALQRIFSNGESA